MTTTVTLTKKNDISSITFNLKTVFRTAVYQLNRALCVESASKSRRYIEDFNRRKKKKLKR